MMKASSGPSPAPWCFRGIAGHGCHREPWQSRTSQTAAWNRLRHPGRGSRRPMAAFDEPLHADGKDQSESERRRGIANQRANSFQNVNIPISSCGRELLQRVHGFLA